MTSDTAQQDYIQLYKDEGNFLNKFYPSYYYKNKSVPTLIQNNSITILNSLVFYRLCNGTLNSTGSAAEYLSSRMEKLFITAYSLRLTFCYGIASVDGVTSLLIGHVPGDDNETIKKIIEGLLPEIEFERYEGGFESSNKTEQNASRYLGCISGIPPTWTDEQTRPVDFSSIMRSLNEQEYTVMALCRPVGEGKIDDLLPEASRIQDDSFRISKASLSEQSGNSKEFRANPMNSANGSGMPLQNLPVTFQTAQAFPEAVNITTNTSRSWEIQNSRALELMNMAKAMSERLKTGRSMGLWETLVSFSSEDKLVAGSIKGSLYSDISSGCSGVYPPKVFWYEDKPSPDHKPEHLIIPKGFTLNQAENPLYSLVTSRELSRLCTIPAENTAGFTVNCCRSFFQDVSMSKDDVPIGNVIDRSRELGNMHFGLNKDDINKHVFVCGMTGYGKTNTVKKILESFDKVPYLVIEPAKKEYRNMKGSPDVYTPGRPELNSIRLNPFYIMRGVSPQQHIDLLKDLFSASFGFYGPLPYIFEKCLNHVYIKKGWNLTLGFHPFLVGSDGCSSEEMFSDKSLRKHYSIQSHKYLFPTMEDLKSELASYIEKLDYEKDVKGNIKSALQSRIDSLCVGAKGYMFNTHETMDFGHLLGNKAVIELEGLADDSDKAFALGLLIVFINEYRQVEKELSDQEGLRHILVVEEAHRLLKNVSQEQSADFGNPKGKAVEHFANMLAEMRSYGQGVIVAEQIPSKLAPDIIKNSSVKIVHRIAAADDQAIVGNTIGLSPEDVIALGANTLGIALCHKDGMFEPVKTRIFLADSSVGVTDEYLYTRNIAKKQGAISCSLIESLLPKFVGATAVKLLVSMMYEPCWTDMSDWFSVVYEEFLHRQNAIAGSVIPNDDRSACLKHCLYEAVISLLASGAFRSCCLPDNELSGALLDVIVRSRNPSNESLRNVYQKLEKFYHRRPEAEAVETVADRIAKNNFKKYDLSARVQCYLLHRNDQFVTDVKKFLDGEWNA